MSTDQSTAEHSELPRNERLRELRSQIGDLGHEMDSRKTVTAAAMGAGVFLLLLAAGAVYDLQAGSTGVWVAIGISRDLILLAGVICGVFGFALLGWALARHRSSDSREQQLSALQGEYDRLNEGD